MAPIVCRELIDDRREWRAMVEHVTTTATQAVQLWLREDEPALGWTEPGTTVSAYEQPFNTWASMPQLIDVERWPDGDRPGSIAYFCGALRGAVAARSTATTRVRRRAPGARARQRRRARRAHARPPAARRVDRRGGSAGTCSAAATGTRAPGAIDTQLCLANVDPSDRYVQCAPGTDAYRLRADESGYDNLVLAGDWTDNGLNAGCIEAATLSGLQAANAVLGRSRGYRIAGTWMS